MIKNKNIKAVEFFCFLLLFGSVPSNGLAQEEADMESFSPDDGEKIHNEGGERAEDKSNENALAQSPEFEEDSTFVCASFSLAAADIGIPPKAHHGDGSVISAVIDLQCDNPNFKIVGVKVEPVFTSTGLPIESSKIARAEGRVGINTSNVSLTIVFASTDVTFNIELRASKPTPIVTAPSKALETNETKKIEVQASSEDRVIKSDQQENKHNGTSVEKTTNTKKHPEP